MALLLETNQRRSRLLFLGCLIIAPVLSPVILPRGALRGWPHSRRLAVTGRSQRFAMGYAFHVVLKGSPYHLCTEGFSRLLCHDLCALTAQSA
jgi:hypothetical protein